MQGKATVIDVRIDAYLSLARTAISEPTMKEIRSQFRHTNPQFQKMRAMGYGVITEPKYYDSYFLDGDRVYIWRGAGKRLKSVLESHGYKIRWVDQRTKFEPTGLTLGKLELFDYQVPAVNGLLEAQQGLLRGHTGSGKTETLLATAVQSQQPTIVQVWNKDLLKQWVERIVKYDILPEREIGIIQGSKNKYGLITIAMVQSLSKRVDEWKDRFGCLILDECQRAPATTFLNSVLPFSAKYKFGGSADEKRKDRKEFLAFEAFGYQEWQEKGASLRFSPVYEIEGRGQSLEPTFVVVPTRYQDPEYEENRNYGQLMNRLTQDEKRNKLIANHLKKSLENGKQVLLFTERVDAAIKWADVVSSWGIEAGPLIGGTENAEQTSRTLERLRTGQCRFASTTSYADVGLDVPSLDAAYVTCPTANNPKRLNQQVGRVVRPHEGKNDPVVFYFWDKHLSGISKGLGKIKRRWKKVIQIS